MPKIPTFTAGRTEMTTQSSGVTSNVQISPNSTIAAALLPAANAVTNYAVKKEMPQKNLKHKKLF